MRKKPICGKPLAKSKKMWYNIFRVPVIRLYRGAATLLCRTVIRQYGSLPFFVFLLYTKKKGLSIVFSVLLALYFKKETRGRDCQSHCVSFFVFYPYVSSLRRIASDPQTLQCAILSKATFQRVILSERSESKFA